MKLILSLITHPNSRYKPQWFDELALRLSRLDFVVSKQVVNQYNLSPTWKPSVLESALYELNVFLMKRRLARGKDNLDLSSNIETGQLWATALEHLRESIAIVFSGRIRDAKGSERRRVFDISLSYLEVGKDVDQCDWILCFEDDAEPALAIEVVTEKIANLIRYLNENPSLWYVDISRSFSLNELNLQTPNKLAKPDSGMTYYVFPSVVTNTMCSFIMPFSRFREYQDQLQAMTKRFASRLIPCDFILSDIGLKIHRIEGTMSLLPTNGIFTQRSLHSENRGQTNDSPR
jgi:hypothetical protein